MLSVDKIVARHLTRAHLARGVTGAISTLVLCATDNDHRVPFHDVKDFA